MSLRFRATTLAAALLVAAATPAGAQERIELFTSIDGVSRILEIDATVSGFGTVRSVTPLHSLNYFRQGPVALSGGRYLVWPTDTGLAVLDRRSRKVGVVPLVDGVPIDVVADRRQPRVFVHSVTASSEQRVWLIDARDPSPRLLFSTRNSILGVAHAPEPDELFVNHIESGPVPLVHATHVVNATTGAPLRRLARADWLQYPQVSDDGRWMWGLTSPFNIGSLDLVDGGTGATLARGPYTRSGFAIDAARGLVITASGDDEFLVAYDARTLTERWRTRLDLPIGMRGHTVEHRVLPGRWMTGAYAVHVENRFDGVCQRVDVAAVDPDGSRRTTAPLLPFAGATGSPCFTAAVLVRSPFAPSGLTATASGGTVALAWRDPGEASGFTVEYGLAPGERAGALSVGAATTVTIPGVPPGTYYVRVTAHNEVGPSPPSNEIRVVVQ